MRQFAVDSDSIKVQLIVVGYANETFDVNVFASLKILYTQHHRQNFAMEVTVNLSSPLLFSHFK